MLNIFNFFYLLFLDTFKKSGIVTSYFKLKLEWLDSELKSNSFSISLSEALYLCFFIIDGFSSWVVTSSCWFFSNRDCLSFIDGIFYTNFSGLIAKTSFSFYSFSSFFSYSTRSIRIYGVFLRLGSRFSGSTYGYSFGFSS